VKIIPAIDLMDGKVVRLFQGKPDKKTIYSSDPIEVAHKWQRSGADMIHIVDLDATLSIGSNFEMIKQIVKELQVPVQIAGGLRDEDTISEALKISNRIVLGTLAFKDKEALKKLLDTVGSEKLVISVDHNDGTIVIEGWQKSTEINLMEGMKEFLEMGITEFLTTNVSRDGTLQGPDIQFLQKACDLKNANVIASGGISSIEDVEQVKECNPFGVILGKAIYENKITIEEAKKVA